MVGIRVELVEDLFEFACFVAGKVQINSNVFGLYLWQLFYDLKVLFLFRSRYLPTQLKHQAGEGIVFEDFRSQALDQVFAHWLDVVPVKDGTVEPDTRAEQNLQENFDLLNLFLGKLCNFLLKLIFCFFRVCIFYLRFFVFVIDLLNKALSRRLLHGFVSHLSLFTKIFLDLFFPWHMGFGPTYAHFSAIAIYCEFIIVDNFFKFDFVFANLNDLCSGVYDEARQQFVVLVLCVFDELSLETSDDSDQRMVLVL